jgi:hypothetical protein
MSKYFIQIVTEDEDEVGDVIELDHYLAGTKPISNLLTEINDRIDEFEDEDDDDEVVVLLLDDDILDDDE